MAQQSRKVPINRSTFRTMSFESMLDDADQIASVTRQYSVPVPAHDTNLGQGPRRWIHNDSRGYKRKFVVRRTKGGVRMWRERGGGSGQDEDGEAAREHVVSLVRITVQPLIRTEQPL